MRDILVFAAHPDDEILGIGGTVARLSENGDRVYGVILGEGQTSRWNKREEADQVSVESLHQNSIRAASIVGYSKLYFADLPDNRFDQVDLLDIIKVIEYYINEIKPEIIYTHHGGDLNIDHELTFRAVLTASRPLKGICVKEIYAFETLSSTEWNFSYNSSFRPNVFVDIQKQFTKKIEAMKAYQSELCEFPHPRSLKGMEIQAANRGSMVGMEYAEAFELIRMLR